MAWGEKRETQEYGRAAGLLTGALATAGALAYLFFAVASHALDKDDYGQIVVLWSATFLVISTLFRPVEQLLAKTVAELREHGASMSHALRVAATIQAGLAAVFTLVAVAFNGPIRDGLFDGEGLLFWSMVTAVLAFSASYYVRGYFAGNRQMGAYASLLILEGLGRLSLALVIAFGLADGIDLAAIAIALAPVVSLIVVPFAILRPQSGRMSEPRAAHEVSEGVATQGAPEFTLARGGGFAIAVLLIMLSEQVLLNSGVLFVRADQDAAAAGFIFNVLMVARAPVVLFQAVAASLLPHLSRLRSRGGTESEEAFGHSIKLTVLVIVMFASAVILGLTALGPPIMQIAFSSSFDYDRLGLVIVGCGMGLYLTAATLNQAALAQGHIRQAATCWVACGFLFAGINLLPAFDAFRRVELGFLASAGLLCAGLAALYLRPSHRAPGLRAGSSQEIEVQLAAADDVI